MITFASNYFFSMEFRWVMLYAIDGILFAVVALTVVYFLVFSIASLFSRHSEITKAKTMRRFIVLIPSYKQDNAILQAVNTILGQTYPQRLFDVVVISDHQNEMTNMRLAQFPITLLIPNFEKSSKAKSLQYAMLNLPEFKIYDCVLVLDADNVVEPEFMEQLNDAFETAGTKTIQTHRMSKNRDTTAARLGSIFEEINNSIFRRGHISVGLSAALNGSGTVFDFTWFKENIMSVRSAIEDKEIESMLIRQHIFVDYFDQIHVYEEKKRRAQEFNSQRGRWVSSQLHTLLRNIRYLPGAILHRQYDQIDKILQWMLVPRTILMGIIAVMSLVLPFIYFTLAIKWWVAAVVVTFAFALATPDYVVDKNWDKDFVSSPIYLLGGFFNLFKAGKTEANQQLLSVKKGIRKIQKIGK